jgi:Asp-tRNA(Asn)/Glu-tRNA(Gln) amidotransferase C subunit
MPPDRVAAMAELAPGAITNLAAAAGLSIPPERLAVVADALHDVLTLAETLDELPLDGVEPVLGPPTWT